MFTFILFLSHLLFCFVFAFFAFHHTVARVTADVTAEVSAEEISTFADLSEISLFVIFFFFVSLYYFRLFVSFVFILSVRLRKFRSVGKSGMWCGATLRYCGVGFPGPRRVLQSRGRTRLQLMCCASVLELGVLISEWSSGAVE